MSIKLVQLYWRFSLVLINIKNKAQLSLENGLVEEANTM
jgi:hypothetical protein